jgi:hypothetical protein
MDGTIWAGVIVFVEGDLDAGPTARLTADRDEAQLKQKGRKIRMCRKSNLACID